MRTCSSCGREIEGDFAFCPHCGAELAAAAPAREQRKTVTVLFCDVTGSTSLGESVDPEALRGLLARYFERMKAIVESPRRDGGEVHRGCGDGRLRRAGVARGRRAARRAGGGGDARRAAGARRSGPDRAHHRRGRDRHRRTPGDRRRGQRRRAAGAGRAAGRGAGRRTDVRARRRRGRGRAGRAARAEGQGRAGSRLPAPARARRAGAAARGAVRRTRARARDLREGHGSACRPSSAASW